VGRGPHRRTDAGAEPIERQATLCCGYPVPRPDNLNTRTTCCGPGPVIEWGRATIVEAFRGQVGTCPGSSP
jgi:hypothetical protein